jgi:hypothetical protein
MTQQNLRPARNRPTVDEFYKRIIAAVKARVARLPDVLFSDQTSQFGHILDDPRVETVLMYSGHL